MQNVHPFQHLLFSSLDDANIEDPPHLKPPHQGQGQGHSMTETQGHSMTQKHVQSIPQNHTQGISQCVPVSQGQSMSNSQGHSMLHSQSHDMAHSQGQGMLQGQGNSTMQNHSITPHLQGHGHARGQDMMNQPAQDELSHSHITKKLQNDNISKSTDRRRSKRDDRPDDGIERKFACANCSYVTHTKTLLSRHMEGSHSDKIFVCTFEDNGRKCGKTFRRSCTLKIHRFIHSGEKPKRCPYCEYSCIQQAALMWHYKTKHPGIPWPYTQKMKGIGRKSKKKIEAEEEMMAEDEED